jgi:hypothetical protein
MLLKKLFTHRLSCRQEAREKSYRSRQQGICLDQSSEKTIAYYGIKWIIESGFKRIKQCIGSGNSQTFYGHAAINPISFSMTPATITWIYPDLWRMAGNTPARHPEVRRPNSSFFIDLSQIIAKTS